MNKKNYIQSINKYNKEKMKLYSVRFHREKQRDIIEHLDSQPNKAGYIARLIREDMERNGVPTKKTITIGDIANDIADNDYVQIIYPDNSSLATTKEVLRNMTNHVVDNYTIDEHPNNRTFIIKVRYA